MVPSSHGVSPSGSGREAREVDREIVSLLRQNRTDNREIIDLLRQIVTLLQQRINEAPTQNAARPSSADTGIWPAIE